MLLATLLRDPGQTEARRALLDRIAGRLPPGARTAAVKQETRGGILHWGRENPAEIDAFRREIRKTFHGRAPRVLDPFAGGGAIPLQAMRLGCEVVAADLNPVAWFVLRCTLHYPRLLAGQTQPLPAFAVRNRDFATAFLQARGVRLFFVEYFSPILRAFLTTDAPSPVRFRGDGFRPAAHRTVHPPSSGAPRRLAPAPLVLDSA